jgi:hypothetical protein
LAPPANSLLFANREATVVLLSLSPMPKFLALLLELVLLVLDFLFLSLLLLLPTLLTEELEDGEEAIEDPKKKRYTVIRAYLVDIKVI